MHWLERLNRFARTLQWERGLRAGVAVLTAMVVCRLLGQPMGWAALGGFEAVLVDNGGPYRTRSLTISTLLAGGAAAGFVGAMTPGFATPGAALGTMAITAAVCFAVTLARVIAQPIASTSVIILVIYFAGLGGAAHSVRDAAFNVGMFCAGGLWAAALSLVLWPVDPFRPARLGVAECFGSLAALTATVGASGLEEAVAARQRQEAHRALRVRLEAARVALAATPARAPARTVTARSLTVLLETADMLFVRTIRLTEILEIAHDDRIRMAIVEDARWLEGAERAIQLELAHRPLDRGASFGRRGSHWLEHVARRREATSRVLARADPGQNTTLEEHLAVERRGALQEVEIGFEAAWTLWTGVDASRERAPAAAAEQNHAPGWLEAVRANGTLQSVMMRHAVRVGLVGAADVLLMRVIHVNHGFWLAMTSIIVLQPYGGSTLRRSVQRVGGTIAGGILAALVAVAVRDPTALTVLIAIFSTLTLATYAVDYGLYCFFLTPTFVLLSLPHPQDWHFAVVRMGTTLLGAAVAVLAMRLVWPERSGRELGRLLGRCAAADAAYLRVLLQFWTLPESGRKSADRQLLAPARRACGMASNDAEEAVDRMMQEPGFGKLGLAAEDAETEQALTFTTYLRRLTQSITTLAAVGRATNGADRRLEAMAMRLERLSASLVDNAEPSLFPDVSIGVGPSLVDVAEEQMQRMERQVGVLERAAMALRQPAL